MQARDPKTGAEASTTVSMSSGLSEDAIQAIIAKDRASDVAPQAPVARARKRVADDNAPVPVVAAEEEVEDVLLDMPALEAEVQESLEKPDAEPMFDRSGNDLGGEAQEPIRSTHAPEAPEPKEFLGSAREIELEPEAAGEDDDRSPRRRLRAARP